jgi:hypothetical protein
MKRDLILKAVLDTWTRRYRQQNFQAWASPLGKTYDPVGKTEMHTPKVVMLDSALIYNCVAHSPKPGA